MNPAHWFRRFWVKDSTMTIEIKEDLVKNLSALGGSESIEQLVEQALEEFIRRHRRQRMLALYGKVKWEGDLDLMRGADPKTEN